MPARPRAALPGGAAPDRRPPPVPLEARWSLRGARAAAWCAARRPRGAGQGSSDRQPRPSAPPREPGLPLPQAGSRERWRAPPGCSEGPRACSQGVEVGGGRDVTAPGRRRKKYQAATASRATPTRPSATRGIRDGLPRGGPQGCPTWRRRPRPKLRFPSLGAGPLGGPVPSHRRAQKLVERREVRARRTRRRGGRDGNRGHGGRRRIGPRRWDPLRHERRRQRRR